MTKDKPVYVWWTPGEPEDDLEGFKTVEHCIAEARGEMGPFLRVIRNHNHCAPLTEEQLIMKKLFDKWDATRKARRTDR